MRFHNLMEPSSACSYVATQRGGVALLFEGHRYNKVRDGKDGTVYWRCSRDRQCPGRAVTVNNRVKKSNNKHNHPPEASLMLRNGSGNSGSTTTGSGSGSGGGGSHHHHHHHHRYSGSSSSDRDGTTTSVMQAAAAAYASFLQQQQQQQQNSGSNNSSNSNNNSSNPLMLNNNNNSNAINSNNSNYNNSNKSSATSQQSSNSISITPTQPHQQQHPNQSRIPPSISSSSSHNQNQNNSPSSTPSPLELSSAINNLTNSATSPTSSSAVAAAAAAANFSSAFSFLQNLAAAQQQQQQNQNQNQQNHHQNNSSHLFPAAAAAAVAAAAGNPLLLSNHAAAAAAAAEYAAVRQQALNLSMNNNSNNNNNNNNNNSVDNNSIFPSLSNHFANLINHHQQQQQQHLQSPFKLASSNTNNSRPPTPTTGATANSSSTNLMINKTLQQQYNKFFNKKFSNNSNTSSASSSNNSQQQQQLSSTPTPTATTNPFESFLPFGSSSMLIGQQQQQHQSSTRRSNVLSPSSPPPSSSSFRCNVKTGSSSSPTRPPSTTSLQQQQQQSQNQPSLLPSITGQHHSHHHHQQHHNLHNTNQSPHHHLNLNPHLHSHPNLNHPHQSMMAETTAMSTTPSSSSGTGNYHEAATNAVMQLQDMFQEAQAAVAAAAFPSLLNETLFKFLSAAAATTQTSSQATSTAANNSANPQMAAAATAALAQTLSNQNLLKNFDLTMATATAAAVVAATNSQQQQQQQNNVNLSTIIGGGGGRVATVDKCPMINDLIDQQQQPHQSPFASLGTTSFRSDLDNSPFYHHHHSHLQHTEDQPLNMAMRDKSNLLKLLRFLMRQGLPNNNNNNNGNIVGGIGGGGGGVGLNLTTTTPSPSPQSISNEISSTSMAAFHALIVPTADAHGSEYIAACDARRQFISDFTGSAGTAVITLNEAALWTDGRYFLQADRELDKKNWILMKQYQPGTPTIGEWLNKVLNPGSRIGIDPHTMSYESWIKLQQELLICGNQLVQTPINLIDHIWTWRPARPSEPVQPLDLKFSGKHWNDKLKEIRKDMLKKDASLLVLTALDDIAWIFNLRGSDIDFNPVFFSYAIITMDRAYLFIDEIKLTSQALNHLEISQQMIIDSKSPSPSPSSTRSTPSGVSSSGGVAGGVGSPQPPATTPPPPQPPSSIKRTNDDNDVDNDEQLSSSSSSSPSSSTIELRPYESIVDFLRTFIILNPKEKIWISNNSNYALVNLIPESRRILTNGSPVTCRKAIKNQIELDGMRRAHIKDAVAICELFSWIEDEVVNHQSSSKRTKNNNNNGNNMDNNNVNVIGGVGSIIKNPLMPMSPDSSSTSSTTSTGVGGAAIVDELSVDVKLEELRRKQKDYIGRSFATIAGSGPNSAVIHYKSSEETNRPITMDEMFLLDCGAQFRDGTTDVTRTIHLGTPTTFEKECFTRVVKGHISLAQARFPRLTKGQFLDSYARRALWDVGLDYNHGTGHGVGMYLNVHEPPVSISNRINLSDPGMEENMILSNEPGYYEPNKFGIRIESLVVTKKQNLKYNFNDNGYLGFETITLLPIQTKLLDVSLLTCDEIKWINDYHQQCREIVGRELEKQGQLRALQWLINETVPIQPPLLPPSQSSSSSSSPSHPQQQQPPQLSPQQQQQTTANDNE